MNVLPGNSFKTTAAKITVKNLDATKQGSFSVTGASYLLDGGASKTINLLESPDTLINSGKTTLDVT